MHSGDNYVEICLHLDKVWKEMYRNEDNCIKVVRLCMPSVLAFIVIASPKKRKLEENKRIEALSVLRTWQGHILKQLREDKGNP